MSSYAFNYSFNVTGNCNAVVQEISDNVQRMRERLSMILEPIERIIEALKRLRLDLGLGWIGLLSGLEQTMDDMLAPGSALNASPADLSAISGATGKELATVEEYARNTAKEFGISASGAVESYKLLLSQLSPELTKSTDALAAMGKHVATLSKTMGGDATAAAEVLTTAMNQYGVSLDDPMEASRKMAEMMNIMAAAGKEGSAELPAIKMALQQCGMAAKAAKVSFAETNAAIQVLDKAGKKGSEGGVALRNVMSTLAQGAFLGNAGAEGQRKMGIKEMRETDGAKWHIGKSALASKTAELHKKFVKNYGNIDSYNEVYSLRQTREGRPQAYSMKRALRDIGATLRKRLDVRKETPSQILYREVEGTKRPMITEEPKTRFVTTRRNEGEEAEYVKHEELREELEELLLEMLE